MPPAKPLPEWDRVLTAAAHLQELLPDAVLVGGTATAIHADHRRSTDADHVLTDLTSRFDGVLAQLESVAGWKTARVRRPVQILGSLDGIETGAPESRWVEEQIGHAVVKAFNNIYAAHLEGMGKPAGTSGRIALPVAGDNAKAKEVVLRLVDQIGFDPVDAGTIADSWRQQPGSPVYTGDFDVQGVKDALARATSERTESWKATHTSPGTFDRPA